jgi:hypothetical protein
MIDIDPAIRGHPPIFMDSLERATGLEPSTTRAVLCRVKRGGEPESWPGPSPADSPVGSRIRRVPTAGEGQPERLRARGVHSSLNRALGDW